MKERSEIIEIVFEGGKLEKIVEFLIEQLSYSILKDYQVSTDSSTMDFHSYKRIYEIIDQSSDGSFYFNFLNFGLRNIQLAKAGVQIIKYDSIYDLNLHLEKVDLTQKISISELLKCAESLAKELKTPIYYCGFEPASDEETRLFSRKILGPIYQW